MILVPPSSRSTRRPLFVGREVELARLADVLDRPRPQFEMRLIVGESGIGKTRLALEIADRAVERGHLVVWGHAWDDTRSPPYWIWTQVVRELAGASGTDLATLVVAEGDPANQAELFDATAQLLQRHTSEQPLLVILDDLHLADPSSIALLEFIATHLQRAPLLILATYQDQQLVTRPEITALVGKLERFAVKVSLQGLDADAVGELAGREGSALDLHASTGGNPFFVQQIMDGHGDEKASLPDVVSRRLSRLGDDVALTLAGTVVLGAASAITDLAALLALPADTVVDHLARAAAAGLVDTITIGHVNPVVAEAVLAAVDPATVEALHGAAVDRLTTTRSPAADRAHHLLRAGALRWQDAVEACRGAAQIASASHAHDEAVGHLRRALGLTAQHESKFALRAEITLELAGAVLRASGRADAEPLYLAAWHLSLHLGEPELIGRAAARHSVQYYFAGEPSRDLASQCRIALRLLGREPSALRARLHGVLAAAIVVDDPGRALFHAHSAVTMARSIGEPIALATALIAEQVADLGPATLRRRLETSREIIALASAARAHDLAVHGRFLLMGALLERGDVREFDAEISRQDALIDQFSAPRFDRHALWFRCTRAMLDGDADLVESLARDCFEIAERLQDPDGIAVFGGQYGVALWMRDRVQEMEGVYLDHMRADPYEPLWPAILAWLWASHGRLDEARGVLARLPAIDEVPQGQYTLLTLVTAADAALASGDDALVAVIWEALLPYHDHIVPVAMGAAVWGTVAQRLGEMALRLGRPHEAIAHLEAAISVCAHMGARPWLTDAQLTLAQVLLDHHGGDDRRAGQLLAEAAATTKDLGLAVFAGRVAELTAMIGDFERVAGAAAGGSPIADGSTGLPRVVVLGTFAVSGTDGSSAHWTSRKARMLLKLLVAQRGASVPRDVIMDALWPGEDPELLSNRLSVALSTVRRALDPTRAHPTNHFVDSGNDAVRLVLDNVVVDTETFLGAAKTAIAAHRTAGGSARELVRHSRELHTGVVLPDEPYADWAEPLRREVEAILVTLLRAEAEQALGAADALDASEAYRLILEIDPYDEGSHRGLIESLRSLGAFGQAEAGMRRYEAAMAEIDVTVEIGEMIESRHGHEPFRYECRNVG